MHVIMDTTNLHGWHEFKSSNPNPKDLKRPKIVVLAVFTDYHKFYRGFGYVLYFLDLPRAPSE